MEAKEVLKYVKYSRRRGAIVERGYDDCKPRRELLAALDAAMGEMEKH